MAACLASNDGGLLVLLARLAENAICSKEFWILLVSAWALGYVVLVLLAAHSAGMQRSLMYIAWTGRLSSRPEKLQDLRHQGLSANVRNIHCDTEDGITLHGYHMAPARLTPALADIHTSAAGKGKGTKHNAVDAFFDDHLAHAKVVILYMHGIALDRAFR